MKDDRASLTRRAFIKSSTALAASACACPFVASLLSPSDGSAFPRDIDFKREAKWYEKTAEGFRCLLCPNGCVRSEGQRSKCHAREPRGDKLYTLVYGLPCVIMLDLVAKCPIYHVDMPEKVFSIATAGCNLGCDYCQNWQFSQRGPEDTKNFRLTPEQVVAKALEKKCPGIAFFYTEPTVYFEYMWDIAGLAKEKGLKTIMVTAGHINEAPLRELAPRIDLFTVGLKGFNSDYYRQTIHGEIKPVLKTLYTLKKLDKWFEVVNLILPGLNDAPKDMRRMSKWIKKWLGADTPLHFTRFRPQYKLRQLPLTPVKTLERAREIALEEELNFVYIGNLPGHEGNHTYCPSCKTTLVSRLGFEVVEKKIENGRCVSCGHQLPGMWQ